MIRVSIARVTERLTSYSDDTKPNVPMSLLTEASAETDPLPVPGRLLTACVRSGLH